MKVLVINSGSSSLKFELIDMTMKNQLQKDCVKELEFQIRFSLTKIW